MELGREILPELSPSLMRVTKCDGVAITMDPAMLTSSRVLRKLASSDGSILLSDAATILACERAALLPSSLGDFGAWLDALDYLCAEPPPELYLGAVARGFKHLLSRRSDDEGGAFGSSSSSVEIMRVIAQRRFLTMSLSQGATAAAAAAARPSSPPRGTKRPGGSESLALLPASGCVDAANTDTLDTLEAAERAIVASAEFEAKRASPFWNHARRQVRCALLGLADSLAGAANVCSFVQRLKPLLNAAQMKWLVHKALTRLYVAERTGEDVFLDLHEVRELQHAYKKSYLDLASLLPLGRLPRTRRAPPLFLLPSCAGRAQVNVVVPSDATYVLRSCDRKVPWLRLLWKKGAQEGVAFYLTGSMLTAALLPRAGLLVEPGDVDIFVLDQSSLVRAVALLVACVDSHPDGSVVESKKISPSKYRIKVDWFGREIGVDLYAHPLKRIHRYHMSAARVAFDGTRLYCSVTGAIALATSVSICFEMAHRAERVPAVLFKRWRAGASLVVNGEELREFVEFSQTGDVGLTQKQKDALEKFRSQSARDGLELHLRASEAHRETVFADYNEWRLPAPRAATGADARGVTAERLLQA